MIPKKVGGKSKNILLNKLYACQSLYYQENKISYLNTFEQTTDFLILKWNIIDTKKDRKILLYSRKWFFDVWDISINFDEFLLLPLSNLFQTSIKFENLIEFEFSREKL